MAGYVAYHVDQTLSNSLNGIMNAFFRFLIGNDFIGSVIFVKTQCRLRVGFTVNRVSLGYVILMSSDLLSVRVHLLLQVRCFDDTFSADSRIYAFLIFSQGYTFHAVWTVSRVRTWIIANCHGLSKAIFLTWQCLRDSVTKCLTNTARKFSFKPG